MKLKTPDSRGWIFAIVTGVIALVLPYAIVSQLLWGSDWWIATAPRLMGVAN